MDENKNIEVGGRFHSIATGNVLAGANEILDDSKGKKQNQINAELESAIQSEVERAIEAENNRYTKSETYSKTQLNSLITTPEQEYVTVVATAQTTAATDVLPATGAADTVYRVGSWDGTQYDATVYSEYAWDGTQYQFLDKKQYGIDDEPTTGSDNLVKSGGVYQYVEGRINDIQTAEIHITDTTGTFSLTPNTFYIFDNIIENVNIVLGTPVSGKLNEYNLEFTCDENSQINFPSTLRWIDDEPLEPEQGYTYQVSIVNGLAVYGAWEGGQND